uniref:Cytochrome P450 n=1 Tax=Panagrolaimus superbus TaxID=310955 RepID=A0A914Y7U4_9BILA
MLGVILLSLFAILIFHQFYWRRLNLPPGPMPWPLIGNLPTIDMKNIDNQLLELKKEYGNVITLWLPKPTVIVGGLDVTITKCFIKMVKSCKSAMHTHNRKNFGGLMELPLDMIHFGEINEDFYACFRDLGVGKPVVEEAIIAQSQEACTHLKNLNGQPIHLTRYMIVSFV